MKLPQYTSQVNLPAGAGVSPQVSPRDYGADAGQALTNLGETMMEIDLAVKKRSADLQRAEDVAGLTLEAHARAADLARSLEEKPDWATHEKNWQSGFGQIKQDIMGRVNDPAIRAAMVGQLGNIETEGLLKAKARSWGMKVDQSNAARVELLNNTQKIGMQLEDPSQVLGVAIGAIESHIVGGIMKAEEGTKEKIQFLERFWTARANQDLDMRPDQFYQDLKSGKYAFINPQNPVMLEEKYVRVKEKEERDAEKDLKRRQEQAFQGYWQDAWDGNINEADLDVMARTRMVDEEQGKALRQVVMKRHEVGYFSDPDYRSRLEYDITINPTDPSIRRRITDGLAARKLNFEDAGKLNVFQAQQVDHRRAMAERKPQFFSDAEGLIRSSVYPTITDQVTHEKNLRLNQSLTEFYDAVRGGKDPLSVAKQISNRNLGLDEKGNPIPKPEAAADYFGNLDNLLYAYDSAQQAKATGKDSPYKTWTDADWGAAKRAIEARKNRKNRR